MSRKYFSIKEVNDQLDGWTVAVQVVERSHTLISRKNNDGLPFIRFVLTDAEGTLVSAVVFGDNIRYFDDLLMPFKRYYVSNAAVKVVLPMYKIGSYPYSWTIKSKTPVEEIAEPIPPMLPCPIELTNFKDLFKYAETEIVQNVMGVVVHVFPLKAGKNQTRDIVIVNEEKICMLLTLWSDYCLHEGSQLANTMASCNVIVAMRVKVTTFNNLSLSTQINQNATGILINPPLPQVNSLKQWYKDNRAIINANLASAVYKNPDFLLPPPDEQYVIDVNSALNVLKDNKTAWVKGRLKLVDPHRSPWYTACGNCKKNVEAQLGWSIKCLSCKEKTVVEPRCRLQVMIYDQVASIESAILGNDAEKMIPFTAEQLSVTNKQVRDINLEISSTLEKCTVICFIKHFESSYGGQKVDRYNVIKVYTVEEMKHHIFHENSPPKQVSQPQFFSPTTSKVLEAIAEKFEPTQKAESSVSSAKRSLFKPEDAMDIESLPKMKNLPQFVQHGDVASPASTPQKTESPPLLKKPREKKD